MRFCPAEKQVSRPSIDTKTFELDETNECDIYKMGLHRPHKDRVLMICGLTIPHKSHFDKELTILRTISLQVSKELLITYTALMKISFGLVLKIHALISILQCLGMVGKVLQSLA